MGGGPVTLSAASLTPNDSLATVPPPLNSQARIRHVVLKYRTPFVCLLESQS